MMKQRIWGAAVLLATLGFLGGCEYEGPAERAGEKVDHTVEDLKDSVDPRGPAEKAGEAVDDALNK
ncbi:MAG: hypothetical protein AB7I30_03945 [Isosphaeraceae bacterium]